MNLLAGLFALALPMVGVVTGVLMIIGAVKMMRLRSYRWAMTASLAALLPCSPAGLLGLIMGIWSLAVLSRPEVKAAFAAQAGGAQRVAPGGAKPRGGPWMGCLVAAILVLLAVPAGLLGLVLSYRFARAPEPPEVATVREVAMTEAERGTPGLSVFRYELELPPAHYAQFSTELWQHGKPARSDINLGAISRGGRVELRLQQGETLSPQGARKLRWDWRAEKSGIKAETGGWIDDPFAAAKGRTSTWRGTERWELVPDKKHTLLILRGWEGPTAFGVSEFHARNPTAFAEAIEKGEVPPADVELHLKVRIRGE